MLIMHNPWEKLVKSDQNTYVLDEDYAMLMTHNKSKSISSRDKFALDLEPQPFTGHKDASIIILNTNPGYSPQDYDTLQNEYFYKHAYNNLLHITDPEYPFFMLSPEICDTLTYKWWHKQVKPLYDNNVNHDTDYSIDLQTISKNIFCIRYCAYHSTSFNISRSFELYSMKYTKYLIYRAMEQHKLILCQRSHMRFNKLVPTLYQYDNIYYAQNPQMPQINEYNFGKGYHKCLTLLENRS
jgi:hypothetical protein